MAVYGSIIELKNAITDSIYENNAGLVTADDVRDRMHDIIDTIDAIGIGGGEYTFQHSLEETDGVVNLVGDVETPGIDQFYCTWGDTVRGWHDIPYHYFQYSITKDEEGYINLVGDAESPGASKYYGTNGDGVKGFYSMAAGDSLPDVHNEVVGTTTIMCTLAEADMTNMTITYTPEGNHALVLFTAPFTQLNAQWDTLYLHINIEGTNVKTIAARQYDGTFVVSFHHLATVTAGVATTVKIRWSGNSSMSQSGAGVAHRTLTVIDLP